MNTPAHPIASQLRIDESRVLAAIELLDRGASVAFIASYRQDATKGLATKELHAISRQLKKRQLLDDRRQHIIQVLKDGQQLSDKLLAALQRAASRIELEDHYLPFKPARRERKQKVDKNAIALLDFLLTEQSGKYAEKADSLSSAAPELIQSATEALAVRIANDACLIGSLRNVVWQQLQICSCLVEGKKGDAQKYTELFDLCTPINSIGAKRLQAMFRGRNARLLEISSGFASADHEQQLLNTITQSLGVDGTGECAQLLWQMVEQAWRTRIFPRLSLDCISQARMAAEDSAISAFAERLRNLLMAAPAGRHVVLGIDPAARSGIAVAVVGANGGTLATDSFQPFASSKQRSATVDGLFALCGAYDVELIALGSGGSSREMDGLMADVMSSLEDSLVRKAVVSDSAARVYSSSRLATLEMPELEASSRVAVGLARRLQDPLMELAKIQPRTIGLGQHQQEVNQIKLENALQDVVLDCIASTGVDLNHAPVWLLTKISGINLALAEKIVAWRELKGEFSSRQLLLAVPGMEPDRFEQCAGFLRIYGGSQPLDSTAIHPQNYDLARKILSACEIEFEQLAESEDDLRGLDPGAFVDEKTGILCVKTVIAELACAGIDPRPALTIARFKPGVDSLEKLEVGMLIEGVVNSVTDFGVFVDLGVYHDGLLHSSEIAGQYAGDLRNSIKKRDVIEVRVTSIDRARKRIGLSTRPEPGKIDRGSRHRSASAPARVSTGKRTGRKPRQGALGDALAAAFAKKKDES